MSARGLSTATADIVNNLFLISTDLTAMDFHADAMSVMELNLIGSLLFPFFTAWW